MNNLRKTAFAYLAAFLVALVALPSTEAQTTTPILTLETPSLSPAGALTPDTGLATAKIAWSYVIDAGYSLESNVATTTTMTWSAPTCERAGIVITGAQTTVVQPTREASGTTASDSGDKSFTVQATQEAPGETPIRCTFKAETPKLGNVVAPSGQKETQMSVVVGYLGLISANVPSTIKQAGPQKEIKYDIEVSNLGNARSTIKFELLNAEGKGKWDPVSPSEIILESTAQGGQETSKVVGFQVSTPFKNGWNNDQTTFQLRITPVSTKDPSVEGTPVTVNVLSRVRGVYVPSLEPVLLLGAVLGSGMVVRLLRRE